LAFIQGVTLVVMCAWPLYRVSPWLLSVFDLYTGCHIGCYKGQAHITTKITPCIKAIQT
jgi:hypothetical protein